MTSLVLPPSSSLVYENPNVGAPPDDDCRQMSENSSTLQSEFERRLSSAIEKALTKQGKKGRARINRYQTGRQGAMPSSTLTSEGGRSPSSHGSPSNASAADGTVSVVGTNSERSEAKQLDVSQQGLASLDRGQSMQQDYSQHVLSALITRESTTCPGGSSKSEGEETELSIFRRPEELQQPAAVGLGIPPVKDSRLAVASDTSQPFPSADGDTTVAHSTDLLCPETEIIPKQAMEECDPQMKMSALKPPSSLHDVPAEGTRRKSSFASQLGMTLRSLSRRSVTGDRRASRSTTPRAYSPGGTMRSGVLDLEHGFEGFHGPEFQKKVRDAMRLEGLPRRQAIIQTRLHHIIAAQGNADSALFYVLDRCPNQAEMKILLEGLIAEGADLQAKDTDGRSCLHAALERYGAKFSHIVEVLLENEASTEVVNNENRLPVEIALEAGEDNTSAIILNYMTPDAVRSLFMATEEATPRFNFYSLLQQGTMMKTCQAVLDSMVEPGEVPDEYTFHYAILEADENGTPASSPKFQYGAKTPFQRLIDIPDLRKHNAVRMLLHQKWRRYGEKQALRNILFYFVFVFLVSFALISAGKQHAKAYNITSKMRDHGDVNVYKSGEAIFRAICEIVILFGVMSNIYQEIQEMRASGLADYLRDPYNYLQLSTALLVLVLVPLRWTEVSEQWFVAAFAYILICLRMLQLLSITRVAGIYLQILVRIVVADMTRFAIIFAIFWITFSGAFYLILIGTDQDSEPTGTTLDNERIADSYQAILLTGLRVMIQAESVLDYIDIDDNSSGKSYHALAVTLNMFFLFIVLIVLLNILIAQLSDTYADVKSDAQLTLEQNWSQALRTIDQTDKMKKLRQAAYEPFAFIEHPVLTLVKWEKPINREQAREADRRQRQLEQQLAKQEQQLLAVRAQVRTVIDLVKEEHVMQKDLENHFNDMFGGQLPGMMEEVVHRNTEAVCTTVDESSNRSVRELESRIRRQVTGEIMQMLEATTEEVVARVQDMLEGGQEEPV